jgi:hypothetical protein
VLVINCNSHTHPKYLSFYSICESESSRIATRRKTFPHTRTHQIISHTQLTVCEQNFREKQHYVNVHTRRRVRENPCGAVNYSKARKKERKKIPHTKFALVNISCGNQTSVCVCVQNKAAVLAGEIHKLFILVALDESRGEKRRRKKLEGAKVSTLDIIIIITFDVFRRGRYLTAILMCGEQQHPPIYMEMPNHESMEAGSSNYLDSQIFH